MVLPLTNSYLLTLPKLGHKELVHTPLSAVLQDCESREKDWSSGRGVFSVVGTLPARQQRGRLLPPQIFLYEKHH